jgi:diguanylate cyclase (GGDEF)-like protein
VLLDVEMPRMSGFEVFTAMKTDAQLRDVPVIFVTSHDAVEQEVIGLTLGAADFIAKPVRPALVAARVRTQLTMKALSDELRRTASTDALTGLPTRRAFDEVLARDWARSERSRMPVSLLMIDVDCFKAYNDRYGHPAGDRCLAAVASALHGGVSRNTDMVARYGGEEFAVLLPGTDMPGARTVAQRLVDRIERLGLAHEASSVAGHVTVSIGGATSIARGGPADLVAAADRALYAAKRAGRGRARVEDAAAVIDPTGGTRASGEAG